jgi:hypothetical protein
MTLIQRVIRKAVAWPYIGRALGVLLLAVAAMLVWRKRQRAAKGYVRAVQDVAKARERQADAVTRADDARRKGDMYLRQRALEDREIAEYKAREAMRERERLHAEIDRAETPEAVADELNRLLGL